MTTHSKNIDWTLFILGVIFIITSIISFTNPMGNLIAVAYIFAVSAILKGLFELLYRNKLELISGTSSKSILITGILDLIIGLFLLFNMATSAIAVPIIFATWFIIDSIQGLFVARLFKESKKDISLISTILNILGLILGIVLLFNPLYSALTLTILIGIYFLTTGIDFIISAF